MIDQVRSWFRENHTLVVFLLAQAVAIVGAIVTVTAYMVRLEARVNTLETRGSSHLAEIVNRLTGLENMTKENHDRIGRVVDIMTRELGKKP